MVPPRDKQVMKVLLQIMILNVVVCVAKLVYGLITRSLSLEADGFHSLMDSSSNLVGLVGVILASKPADAGHPYGHRKIEALASMSISFLLFVTGYEVITSVIERIKNPIVPEVGFLSFAIMGVTMAVNYLVATYERKQGDLLKSDILIADSIHTRMDILISFSVLVSFAAVLLKISIMDIVIAAVIVVHIGVVAFRVLMTSVNILLDAPLIDPAEIEGVVQGIPGVARCHKIRSRGTRSGVFIDLHIHVNPEMNTEDSHTLTHKVINTIKEKFPSVIEVLIHTEPAYTTKPREDLKKEEPC